MCGTPQASRSTDTLAPRPGTAMPPAVCGQARRTFQVAHARLTTTSRATVRANHLRVLRRIRNGFEGLKAPPFRVSSTPRPGRRAEVEPELAPAARREA